ncbi:MAG: DUF4412 domain-containing protein [Candidatus Aminicenantes bacterium]|nr:DUF4412 domain-containing protein [Candidatus Aminicenantes bacterium]
MEEITDIWIGEQKFAFNTPRFSQIIDRENNFFTIINHRKKTYVQAKLPLNPEKFFPGETAALMKETLAIVEATAEATGKEKLIGDLNCTEYKIEMEFSKLSLKMTVWASTDVSLDWKKINSVLHSNWIQLNLPLAEKTRAVFQKIEGLFVSTELNWSYGDSTWKTTTEITEITEKPAEENVYVVPEDYKQKDSLNPGDLR